MKRRLGFALIVVMFMFSISVPTQATGYSSELDTGIIAAWNVEEATNFTLWYTGGGYCAVENNSIMEFQIGDVEEEVFGVFSIGNVSVSTNDTMVALDLTLGIWPSWLSGLFVEVGQSNIESLNASAYAAAERVSGNWMNGTMSSRYENITVGQTEHQCIVFDYEQDPPGTQVTHLVYSLATGVLVEVDTTVTFGSTYKLVATLASVGIPSVVDLTANPDTMIVIAGVIGGGILAVAVIVYIQLSRRRS